MFGNVAWALDDTDVSSDSSLEPEEDSPQNQLSVALQEAFTKGPRISKKTWISLYDALFPNGKVSDDALSQIDPEKAYQLLVKGGQLTSGELENNSPQYINDTRTAVPSDELLQKAESLLVIHRILDKILRVRWDDSDDDCDGGDDWYGDWDDDWDDDDDCDDYWLYGSPALNGTVARHNNTRKAAGIEPSRATNSSSKPKKEASSKPVSWPKTASSDTTEIRAVTMNASSYRTGRELPHKNSAPNLNIISRFICLVLIIALLSV